MGSGRGKMKRVLTDLPSLRRQEALDFARNKQRRSGKVRNVLYFRHGYEEQLAGELKALRGYFFVTDSLDELKPGDRVLCRFSTLPFPELLQEEVERRGASLVHDNAAGEDRSEE